VDRRGQDEKTLTCADIAPTLLPTVPSHGAPFQQENAFSKLNGNNEHPGPKRGVGDERRRSVGEMSAHLFCIWKGGPFFLIKLEHVTKRYGAARGVEDITFDVAEGEILGFLGPNGAGKTTTMRVITGYHPATSGTVTM
jgi:ABC-type glutathione transport system ATPase component